MKYCPDDDGSCSSANVDLREMLDEIEAIPAVDAEPVRHGRWKDIGYITTAYGSIDTGCCSECGAVDVPIEPYDYYCPCCGAMMTRTYGGAE